MPLLCVDLIIRRGDRVLLIKRENEPLRGFWWVPGGRVLKGETLLDAAKRKAASEVGLDIEPRFVGIYEGRFETSAQNVPAHSVSIVFEAEAEGEVKLDSQSSAFMWGNLPKRFSDSFSKA